MPILRVDCASSNEPGTIKAIRRSFFLSQSDWTRFPDFRRQYRLRQRLVEARGNGTRRSTVIDRRTEAELFIHIILDFLLRSGSARLRIRDADPRKEQPEHRHVVRSTFLLLIENVSPFRRTSCDLRGCGIIILAGYLRYPATSGESRGQCRGCMSRAAFV